MKEWYVVVAVRSKDVNCADADMVAFYFFGDPGDSCDIESAVEIAKNKLHTTDDIFYHFLRK